MAQDDELARLTRLFNTGELTADQYAALVARLSDSAESPVETKPPIAGAAPSVGPPPMFVPSQPAEPHSGPVADKQSRVGLWVIGGAVLVAAVVGVVLFALNSQSGNSNSSEAGNNQLQSDRKSRGNGGANPSTIEQPVDDYTISDAEALATLRENIPSFIADATDADVIELLSMACERITNGGKAGPPGDVGAVFEALISDGALEEDVTWLMSVAVINRCPQWTDTLQMYLEQ